MPGPQKDELKVLITDILGQVDIQKPRRKAGRPPRAATQPAAASQPRMLDSSSDIDDLAQSSDDGNEGVWVQSGAANKQSGVLDFVDDDDNSNTFTQDINGNHICIVFLLFIKGSIDGSKKLNYTYRFKGKWQ